MSVTGEDDAIAQRSPASTITPGSPGPGLAGPGDDQLGGRVMMRSRTWARLAPRQAKRFAQSATASSRAHPGRAQGEGNAQLA